MTYSYATMPLPFFGLLLICDLPLKRPRAGLEHLTMCALAEFVYLYICKTSAVT